MYAIFSPSCSSCVVLKCVHKSRFISPGAQGSVTEQHGPSVCLKHSVPVDSNVAWFKITKIGILGKVNICRQKKIFACGHK